MSANVPPSRDPSVINNPSGALMFLLRKFLANEIDGMLPVTVLAYNDASNIAQVSHLIQKVATNSTTLQRGVLAAVPVLRLGFGGMVIRFTPTPGSTGWIIASDRDISLFKQSLETAAPNTKRMHSFSDGLFIPDIMTAMTVAADDAGLSTIQSGDGTVRIAFHPNLLKITAPNVSIGDVNGYAPNTGAILDIISTDKAFGLPAMTTAQKNAIASPRPGFMVFDLTENGVSVYNGTAWS